MLHLEDLSSVSWNCVHFADHNKVIEVLGEVTQLPFFISKANVKNVNTEQDLFNEVASVLKFPYFGRNWDALNDCLCDMDWIPARGYLLILESAKDVWSNAPQVAGQFISSWQTAAQFWGEREKVPFHLVFSF